LTAVASGAASAGLLTLPGVASAHANLDTTVPAPGPIDALPDTLSLTFTELLDRASAATLYDVNGAAVDGAASAIDPTNRLRLLLTVPPLPPAPYTVGWTSVSAEDGHELSSFYALLAGGAPGISGPPTAARQLGAPPADLDVGLSVTPDAQGVMQWVATVAGPTANIVQRVSLRFTSPLPNQGVDQRICQPDPASGAYLLGVPMALAGDWQIDAIVRRLNVADDLRVPFGWTALPPTTM
jgi:methionine-rich copper-binding protein CopC